MSRSLVTSWLSLSLFLSPPLPFPSPWVSVRQVNALQTTHQQADFIFWRCFWVGGSFTGITAEVREREKDLRATVRLQKEARKVWHWTVLMKIAVVFFFGRGVFVCFLPLGKDFFLGSCQELNTFFVCENNKISMTFFSLYGFPISKMIQIFKK